MSTTLQYDRELEPGGTQHIGNVPWMWARGYQVPAERKSIEDCASHGRDHKAYGWSPQMDPTWSPAQLAAYKEGYGYK